MFSEGIQEGILTRNCFKKFIKKCLFIDAYIYIFFLFQVPYIWQKLIKVAPRVEKTEVVKKG